MAANERPIRRPDLAEPLKNQTLASQALFSVTEADAAGSMLDKYARQQSRCRSMVTRALDSCEMTLRRSELPKIVENVEMRG